MRLKQEIDRLKSQLASAREVIIFYSGFEDYEKEYYVLDWDLVNNDNAIQDRGKYARQWLKDNKE